MAKRKPAADIRAAGGVLWRRHGRRLEVAVVHRPRYDDWSLPKGKLDDGETELAAAVREVAEETGAQVRVSRFVTRTSYRVHGATKSSAFWSMQYRGGEFAANHEVDELSWLPVSSARDTLTYDTDRAVLADFAAVPPAEAVVLLVRHAKAGRRSNWSGEDDLRPLDRSGRLQAKRLVSFLDAFGPQRIVSAEPLRCVQTVTPFAEHAGLTVAVDPLFGDSGWSAAPVQTIGALFALARRGGVTAIASQGSAIPGLIGHVVPGDPDPTTRKAALWALGFVDAAIAFADYYDPASYGADR